MAEYTFDTLSALDFEALVRDLLEARLELRLESFGAGVDGGVDLRAGSRERGNLVVVQCKHYLGSTVSQLMAAVRKELPKVQRLEPDRYILVTSQNLSPNRKDEIVRILSPYSRSAGDVVTRNDLNQWIAENPRVEERHPKLWMTSAGVLARVLNAHIFDAGLDEVEKVRRNLQRCVITPDYSRASAILEEFHVCVIAGNPGVGKTTLARLLLMQYAEKHGFAVVPIQSHVREIATTKRRGERQIFYFDDFLGQTSFVEFYRNEDRHLVDLLEEVHREPNWRFVLTTREYVLREAQQKSEALHHLPFEFNLCTIEPTYYTKLLKAEILYNHLYFSDLPRDYVLQVLSGSSYRKIVGHRNYNPRIVEHMTTAVYVSGVPSDGYAEAFLATLDDPRRVWATPFDEHLKEEARDLLLVLASLPNDVVLADLETAWTVFQRVRSQAYNRPRTTRTFERVLRPLLGAFVMTSARKGVHSVAFANPSVRDFLESHLAETPADVADLLEAAVFFDQVQRLARGSRGESYPAFERSPAALASALIRTFERTAERDRAMRMWFTAPAPETRLHEVLELADRQSDPAMEAAAAELVARVEERWRAGRVSAGPVATLLMFVHGVPSGPRWHAFKDSASAGPVTRRVVPPGFSEFGKRVLLDNLDGPDVFSRLELLLERIPNFFSEAEMEEARERFRAHVEAEGRVADSAVASGHWKDRIREIEDQALALGLDPNEEEYVSYALDRMQERMDEMDSDYYSPSDPIEAAVEPAPLLDDADSEASSITKLFERLKTAVEFRSDEKQA